MNILQLLLFIGSAVMPIVGVAEGSVAARDEPVIRDKADAIRAERSQIVDVYDDYVTLARTLQETLDRQKALLRKQKEPVAVALKSQENRRQALIDYQHETQTLVNQKTATNQQAYDAHIEWLEAMRKRSDDLNMQQRQQRTFYQKTRAEHDQQAQKTKELINEYNLKVKEYNYETGAARVELATWLSSMEPILEANRKGISMLRERALLQYNNLNQTHDALARHIRTTQSLKQQEESILSDDKMALGDLIKQRQAEITRMRNALSESRQSTYSLMAKERELAIQEVLDARQSIETTFSPEYVAFGKALDSLLNTDNHHGVLFGADGKTTRFNTSYEKLGKVYKAVAAWQQLETELQQIFENVRAAENE